MPILEVDGGSLYYETTGQVVQGQPAVVLIHAGIANLRMWDDQVAVLGERHFVVRYDLRGFGRSSKADTLFSERADLLAVLDSLNLERAILIGCSRGGGLALDFTLEHPERVTALVTVCASPGGLDFEMPPEQAAHFGQLYALWQQDPNGDVMHDYMIRTWVSGLHRPLEAVDPDLRKRVRAMLAENGETPGDDKLVALDPLAAGRLHEIHLPTLVIVGAVDNAYVVYAGDVMAREIAGARKVTIDDAAHLPNMEHPQTFNREVLGFIQRFTVES